MPNDLPRGRNHNNTSGYAGVSFNPQSQKWQAQITFHKIRHYLGLFASALEASIARKDEERRLRRLEAGLPV